MYHDFASAADFRKVESFIGSNIPSENVLLVNADKRVFVIKADDSGSGEEYNKQIVEFIKAAIN
jgi:hypothetical protein